MNPQILTSPLALLSMLGALHATPTQLTVQSTHNQSYHAAFVSVNADALVLQSPSSAATVFSVPLDRIASLCLRDSRVKVESLRRLLPLFPLLDNGSHCTILNALRHDDALQPSELSTMVSTLMPFLRLPNLIAQAEELQALALLDLQLYPELANLLESMQPLESMTALNATRCLIHARAALASGNDLDAMEWALLPSLLPWIDAGDPGADACDALAADLLSMK